MNKLRQYRKELLFFSAILLLILTGTPQSPFSVIKGIKKKISGSAELEIPAGSLSSELAVSSCAAQSLESVYDSSKNFNPAKSGLNVFKARLVKEYNNASKNFSGLALKSLINTENPLTTNKTCLVPLKISVDSKLSTDIADADLLNVSLGLQTIFCSKKKAYLNHDSGFYLLQTALEDYARQIKEKKAVLTLKKQLTDLKAKKARLPKNKTTEREKLDKKIRQTSLSISYAKYFSGDSLLLGSFFDSVCSQASAIATPNINPSTITPLATNTARATQTPLIPNVLTPTITAKATVPSGRIAAPNITSPNTVTAVNGQVTVSWSAVASANGYLTRYKNITDNTPEVQNNDYRDTSMTFPVISGKQYLFWVHTRASNFSFSDTNSYSLEARITFTVSADGITPTVTPTATTPGTITSDFKIGDRVQMLNATKVRSEGRISDQTLRGEQAVGSVGTIIEGPTTSDDDYGKIVWWKVDFDSGEDGWSGENNYKKLAPACTNGQTETRTFWEALSVPSGQRCKSQSQLWTCVNGNWQRTTGTYEYSSCFEQLPPGSAISFNAYDFTKVFQNGIHQQYIGNTWTGGENTPYGDHLFYNFMVDGYGGLPMGSCLQRSQFITNQTERAICAKVENSDLFRAGTSNSSPTRNLLVKNVLLKNAFRPINVVGGTATINGVPVANSVQNSVDKPHTDTFQAYMGGISSALSQDTANKVGWLVIQDSIFKNSDNGAMVHGDTHYKGALYQNLSTFCEDAFKQDTYARNANDGKNFPGNQGVNAAYPCGNQIAFGTYYNAPVWLVNVSTSNNMIITSNPGFGAGSGPVIVVGNQVNIQGYGSKTPVYKKDANGNNVLDADGKPIIINWNAAPTLMNPPNVVRFNYIEEALSAGYAKPPYIELSCSGWKNPPAGCESRQGYLNTNQPVVPTTK